MAIKNSLQYIFKQVNLIARIMRLFLGLVFIVIIFIYFMVLLVVEQGIQVYITHVTVLQNVSKIGLYIKQLA